MRGPRHWIDHRWARGRMSAYVDGELTSAQRRRLEAHAERCGGCRRMRRSLLQVVWALRTLRPRSGSALSSRVIRRLRDEFGE